MSEIVNCPLSLEIENMQEATRNLVRSMRRLSRKLKACRDCEYGTNCPIMAQFDFEVQTAISEITTEWKLAEMYGLKRHEP